MKNLFIGIDFSKEKVDVAIIFADGLTETAARVFNEFKTTVSGYKQLVKWVKQNSYPNFYVLFSFFLLISDLYF